VLPDAFVPASLDVTASSIDVVAPEGDVATRWRLVAAGSAPLIVTGPLGKGFAVGGRIRRALLVDGGSAGAHLLYLARFLIDRNIEVVYVARGDDAGESVPATKLPAEIEYRPARGDEPGDSGLMRAVDQLSLWPDAAFLSGSGPLLLDLAALLRRRLLRLPRGFAQAIVAPGCLPCGVGACGLCSVTTRDGSRRRCRDGLVFDLLDLV
jgi:dihydroorotate dehydrogenase electron transfer subunit